MLDPFNGFGCIRSSLKDGSIAHQLDNIQCLCNPNAKGFASNVPDGLCLACGLHEVLCATIGDDVNALFCHNFLQLKKAKPNAGSVDPCNWKNDCTGN
jgi:hypothetical protein